MAKLQYIGLSHNRIITVKDIKSLGFTGSAIKVHREDHKGRGASIVEDVPDDLANWLVENEVSNGVPQWRLIEDEATGEQSAAPAEVNADETNLTVPNVDDPSKTDTVAPETPDETPKKRSR